MKYNIENAQCIGEGNFAKVYLFQFQVYKIYDKQLNTYLALRLVDKVLGEQQDILKEKNINKQLMKVDSPFILKIYDIQQDQKSVLYVTQYCEGGSLWQCISEQPNNKLQEIHAIYFTLKIAKGIQILHNNKITHRDLKPENILLQKKYKKNEIPEIKIADFGLSTNKMIMETVAGTKQYIAPEQAKFQSYTNAVDIWALGIILDEMIHGNTFYCGQSNSEIFKKITNQQYHVRDNKISTEIKDLLSSMLKKKPFQRPTIGEIILKLQNWIIKNEHKTPKKHREGEKANSMMKVNQTQQKQKNIIKGQLDILQNSNKCKMHKKQLLYIENEELLCIDCINEKTILIQQYFKNQESPYDKLFEIKDTVIEFEWDVIPQFEKTRQEFKKSKSKFKYINSNLKKQSEIIEFLNDRPNQKLSLDRLKSQYQQQLDQLKSEFFSQIQKAMVKIVNKEII